MPDSSEQPEDTTASKAAADDPEDQPVTPKPADDVDGPSQPDEDVPVNTVHDVEEAQPAHVFDDDPEMDPSNTDKDAIEPRAEKSGEMSQSPRDDAEQPTEQAMEAHTLFAHIFASPADVSELVAEWMGHIQTNGPAAVAAILSLVVSMSRAVQSPPPDVFASDAVIANDPTTSVAHASSIIANDTHGRVLIAAKDTSSRRSRRAYEDFWRKVAADTTDVVVYDTDCFDTLVVWLDAMATSPSRSLRLASCLAAYRLVDGFIEKGNKLRKQLATMQRQLNTEKKRCGVDDKRRKKEGPQLSKKGKELVKKVDDLTANNAELIELSDKVFRTLFIVKYRDVSSEIRNASVSALGGWILSFPDHFLDDSNNKYVGWLLSDKDPGVRKSSLDVLMRMLKKKDFFASLELFLKRFCDRIVEMTRDKDDHVSSGAISLLSCLVEHGIVENEACEQVCDMAMEETHIDIRRAAGEFLARLILAQGAENNDASPSKGGRGRRKPDGVINRGLEEIPPVERSSELLKELLFTITRKEQDSASPFLAVDAVWDSFPALRCWEAYSILLMESDDSSKSKSGDKRRKSQRAKSPDVDPENSISESDRAFISEMLLASAAEASGNGDSARARIIERGERLNSEPPAVHLTQHFLPLLPKLLARFQTDLRALSALVKLPIHFAPKCFDQEGQEKHFVDLLAKIIDVLTRNTGSPEVSSACGETLRSLLNDQNPLKQQVVTALQLGCTEAAKELAIQIRSDLTDAEPDSVAAAVLRLRILSALVDPGSSVQESVLKLFQHLLERVGSTKFDQEVTADASHVACSITIWSLAKMRSRFENVEESFEEVSELLQLDDVRDARQVGSAVIDLLHRALSADALPIDTRLICVQTFLTLLTLATGIENYVLSRLSEGQKEQSDDTPSVGELDLLQVRGSEQAIIRSLFTCVNALLENQLGCMDRRLISSVEKKGKLVPIADAEIRNCFASLIQASFQSPLSNEISHLPLLGLLLKQSRNEVTLHPTENVTPQLCRRYCQQRQLREGSIAKDEARALHHLANLEISEGGAKDLVREMAESLISTRQYGELKANAAHDLLRALIGKASPASGATTETCVLVLTNAGLTLVPHLSEPQASSLLEEFEELTKELAKTASGDNDSGKMLHLDTLNEALKSVSEGRTLSIPRLPKKAGKRGKQKPKKRRRTSQGAVRLVQASDSENQNVRRSSRGKKRVDYARMQGAVSEPSSESDDSESSEEEEEEEEEQNVQAVAVPSETQNAAEMARNIMKFSHSPRPASRDLPDVSRLVPNPRKRMRAIKPKPGLSTELSIGPAHEDESQDEGEDTTARRSERAKRLSARLTASVESGQSPIKPRRANRRRNARVVTGRNPSADKEQEPEEPSIPDDEPPRRADKASESPVIKSSAYSQKTSSGKSSLNDAAAESSERDSKDSDDFLNDGSNNQPDARSAAEDQPRGDSSAMQTSSGKESSTLDGSQDQARPLSALEVEENEEPGSGEAPPASSPVQSDPPIITSPKSGSNPRKSSRLASRGSPKKSKSPAMGRIQKPTKQPSDGANGFSQANKENVENSPSEAVPSEHKAPKIRRRRRRQW